MLADQSDELIPTFEPFEDLNGYEKGALARALIKNLIKQATLDAVPGDESPGLITVSINRGQLKLLARFNEDGEPEEDDDEREILLDELCQLR